MKLRSSQVKHDSDYMWFFATPSLDSWTPAVVRRGWVATRGPPQAAPAEVVVAVAPVVLTSVPSQGTGPKGSSHGFHNEFLKAFFFVITSNGFLLLLAWHLLLEAMHLFLVAFFVSVPSVILVLERSEERTKGKKNVYRKKTLA